MTDTVCMLPWCNRAKDHNDAMCRWHWGRLPSDLVEAYWDTKPYSNERRGMLLKVFRWAFANRGRMDIEAVKADV